MNANFKKLKKIQLIEEPRSEELLRSEIEDALAGWQCTCFDQTGGGGGTCTAGYSPDAVCSGSTGKNFCSNRFSF